jgi:osmoprotectant transport system substrate-binding protein
MRRRRSRTGSSTAIPSTPGPRCCRSATSPRRASPRTRPRRSPTRRCFAGRGYTALAPTPFTSSNEVGVTQAVAQQNDLQRISDLAAVDQDFTLFGSRECRRRSDCLAGLQDVYGLHFKAFTPVEIDERHDVLRLGSRVASIVFTTDPQIKRENLVLLEDDRGMFPPNNSTFVVRDEILEEAGQDLPKVVGLVQRGLTDEVMQELNARVDLDREDPADVAGSYLEATGLVGAA